jgi:hypothetical protein
MACRDGACPRWRTAYADGHIPLLALMLLALPPLVVTQTVLIHPLTPPPISQVCSCQERQL